MNNFRRSDTVTPNDTYLTPPWAIQFLLEHWQPIGGTVCDPCACGYRGYSVGSTVAQATNKPVELYDLNPMDQSVKQADFRDLTLPIQSRSIVTNPPFNLAYEFVKWGLEQADEVVILVRYGWLTVKCPDRSKHLVQFLQPRRRMAFMVLPDHIHQSGQAIENKSSMTGWSMPASPVDHGWAVFRRNYTGPTQLILAEAHHHNT